MGDARCHDHPRSCSRSGGLKKSGDQFFVEAIKKSGAEVVIPPKKNRKVHREYDKHLYQQRNQIERLFGKLKQCRCIAPRYEKTSRNDMAFLHLAATMILLA